MLGYICKYAPIEVFEVMGVEMKRIEPDVASFGQADMRMHPNICSFAKGVLEEIMKNRIGWILYVSCAPDTLARDLAVLRTGGYRVLESGLIDMFPSTAHFETVTLLKCSS